MWQSHGWCFSEFLLLDRSLWWTDSFFFFFFLQFHSVPTSFYLCGWAQAITILSLLSKSWAVCLTQRTLLCLLSASSIFSSRVEILLFMYSSLSHVQIPSDRLSRFCFCVLQNLMTQERLVWLFPCQWRGHDVMETVHSWLTAFPLIWLSEAMLATLVLYTWNWVQLQPVGFFLQEHLLSPEG